MQVTDVDTAGIEAITHLYEKIHQRGGTLMFSGVHDSVLQMFKRADLTEVIGRENFFWSSDQAIVAAEQRHCGFCE